MNRPNIGDIVRIPIKKVTDPWSGRGEPLPEEDGEISGVLSPQMETDPLFYMYQRYDGRWCLARKEQRPLLWAIRRLGRHLVRAQVVREIDEPIEAPRPFVDDNHLPWRAQWFEHPPARRG